jgi:hypothetical protein
VSPPRSKCLVDGCDRLEELASGRSAGGLCAGHRKRKVRGLPIWTPLDSLKAHRHTPRELLIESAIALGDVDPANDSAWGRAIERQCRAAVRYAAWVLQKARRLGKRGR